MRLVALVVRGEIREGVRERDGGVLWRIDVVAIGARRVATRRKANEAPHGKDGQGWCVVARESSASERPCYQMERRLASREWRLTARRCVEECLDLR